MDIDERKQRIRQLWGKVRMFVRLRHNLNAVKVDIEIAEEREMLDQGPLTDDEE